MPSFVRPLMVLAASLLALAEPVTAQSLDDPILPGGRLRLGVLGWYSSAHERGFDPAVPLGASLTRDDASQLFPGAGDLRARFADALADDAGAFPLRLGAAYGTVTESKSRVPMSADVGVFDWLTVGVTVPMVRTRVETRLQMATDSTSDLGLNPGLANLGVVQGFVTSLSSRAAEAAALADELCGQDPSSEDCTGAQALADDLDHAHGAFVDLFATSVFFPAAGTPTGAALQTRVASLDERLTARGLGGLGGLPLAGEVADAEAVATLLADPQGAYRYISGPQTIRAPWELGDVEARVAVRLFDGRRGGGDGEPATFMWRLAALGGVRLPTSPDRITTAILLPRGDDGQLDLFAGGYAGAVAGPFALRLRAVYTRQQSTEVEDRIAPPDVAFSPVASLTRLEWDPGDEFDVEVQPAFRLAPALSLSLSWRYWRRTDDRYTRLDPAPAAPADPSSPEVRIPVETDATLLQQGTYRRLQELGGSLTYRTTELPGLDGGTFEAFEAFGEIRRVIAGAGAFARPWTRASFGARVLWRLWGG